MGRHLLYILLVLMQLQAAATGSKVDSLELLLRQGNLSRQQSLSALNALGFELWTVDPSRSVQVGRDALHLARELENKDQEAYAYKVIGVAYWALGDYQLALDHMLKSLSSFQKLGDRKGVGSMLLNIGLVYSEQLSYSEAKEYFRRAIHEFIAQGREVSRATALTKLATVLSFQDSMDLAKTYLAEAVEIHRSHSFRYGLAEAYNRLGIVYRLEGDYNASLDYLYRSRDISQEIQDNEGLAKCYADIAATFSAMGRPEEAETYYLKSVQKSTSIGSKKWRMQAYLGLSTLYESQGRHSEALGHYRKYHDLHDSVLNRQKIMAIAHLQEEFKNRERLQDLENSRMRIADLQTQARSRSTLMVVLSILFVLLVTSIALAYRNQNLRANRLLREQMHRENLSKMEREKQEVKLENARLRAADLERQLELKHRELASYALNFLQKNEFIAELNRDLTGIKSSTPALQKIKQKLRHANRLDRDWENFRMRFEKVHSNFTDQLKEAHPDLSPAEIKLATLIRINLNTKECASVLGISPESVKTARHRLRKKIGIGTEASLYESLSSFGA